MLFSCRGHILVLFTRKFRCPQDQFLTLFKTDFFIYVLCGGIFCAGTLAHYSFGYWWKIGVLAAYGPDDSFINYQYAKNLAAGLGLVFNPGERVEGYSALLHVLLMAVGAKLTPNHLFEFANFINLGFMLILGAFYYRIAKKRWGKKAIFALLFISLHPSLWLWTSSGLESPLVAALAVLIWIYTERISERPALKELYLLMLWCFLAVLIHIDGILTVAISSLFLLLRKRTGLASVIGGTGVFVFGSQVFFRMKYYGLPLNNPYYVKLDGQIPEHLLSGIKTIWQLCTQTGWSLSFLVLSIGAVTALVSGLRKKDYRLFNFPALFFSMWVLYFLFIGGDYFNERLILSFAFVVPFVYLQLAEWYPWLNKRLIYSFFLVFNFIPYLADPRFDYSQTKRDIWREAGLYLKDNHSGAVIAVDGAGKIPFYSGLYTIDMLGYVDAHVAQTTAHEFTAPGHNKFDPEYILSRQPDLIAIHVNQAADGYWGMERSLYKAHGYEPYLLFYSDLHPNGEFKKIEGMDIQSLRGLLSDKLNYMLLKRQGYRHG